MGAHAQKIICKGPKEQGHQGLNPQAEETIGDEKIDETAVVLWGFKGLNLAATRAP